MGNQVSIEAKEVAPGLLEVEVRDDYAESGTFYVEEAGEDPLRLVALCIRQDAEAADILLAAVQNGSDIDTTFGSAAGAMVSEAVDRLAAQDAAEDERQRLTSQLDAAVAGPKPRL